jgi:hypothetical protein
MKRIAALLLKPFLLYVPTGSVGVGGQQYVQGSSPF